MRRWLGYWVGLLIYCLLIDVEDYGWRGDFDFSRHLCSVGSHGSGRTSDRADIIHSWFCGDDGDGELRERRLLHFLLNIS